LDGSRWNVAHAWIILAVYSSLDASRFRTFRSWLIASFPTHARISRFVHRLQDARAGRDAWVDWDRIPPTADWLKEIHAAIDGADAFVFTVSVSSVASRVCLVELERAISTPACAC